MKVYKATNKDMQCTPGGKVFQYERGVTYEKPKAELCAHGFHACEAPLDVFGYYAPGEGSRYFEAELEDVSPERREDSKVSGRKITLGAEIGIPGLVKAHVEYVKEHIDTGKKQTNTGDASAATNTGYASAATNTGDASAATNTGNRSAATNTGDASAATVADGGSVAIVTGRNSNARAGIGSAIVICERGEWNGETYPLLAIKAAIVDGEAIKPDTWYTLKDGEFSEVKDDE